MEKTKLTSARLTKGFSQAKMAQLMGMTTSTYSRKENGHSKIHQEEWDRLAKSLDVPVEDIYESEESMVFICKDQATGNYQGTNNIYSVPEYLLDSQRKYIAKLEEENEILKAKNNQLELENERLRGIG
jgi:transcriptional regulator with XRE-family HTH domain